MSTTTETETQIFAALQELSTYSPEVEWHSIAALYDTVRSYTTMISREVFNAALVALSRAHLVLLTPEENQKTINDADRNAAIILGGVEQHLVARI